MDSKYLLAFIFILILKLTKSFDYSSINLPPSHLGYYFNQFPQIKEKCLGDTDCVHHKFLQSIVHDEDLNKRCWGYETTCTDPKNRFSSPNCWGDETFERSKASQIETFYYQTDFGYVKEQISELSVMCEPLYADDSSLECTGNLRFCRGKNIMMNFTDLTAITRPFRYNMDVFKTGQISGHCKLYKERLMNETDHMGALQSWAPELRFFTELDQSISSKNYQHCDVIIDKPTFIMKVDAYSNMYHHFCDFFNLYASLHLNASNPHTFSTDVHILVWETFTYNSPFRDTFKAFTNYPVWDLKMFQGKTVCFRNVILPLLPRMIFGLYYNTPILSGCEKSGLFKTFSEFILHRLRIPFHYVAASSPANNMPLRITFLARQTKYRRVLNENELMNGLHANQSYRINVVSFEKGMNFMEQLEIIRNTDILIGMHGAGLTHLLFLPDWGTIFELYNCEDPQCYKDLARLRNVNYMTWEDEDTVYPEDMGHHPEGGAHAKFTNYKFNLNEFIRLIDKAAAHVLNHKSYQNFVQESRNYFRRDEL